MSGFSPEWLALREPVDHRSRAAGLAARLAGAVPAKPALRVVDLGCGTGSNIRATAPLLPAAEQHWTLVDYDPRLLSAARRELTRWAGHDAGDDAEATLRLEVAGKTLRVDFKQVDLDARLDDALGAKPDLVTASAFFDLCSPAFIARFARAVTGRRAVFYTVLTYDGVQQWSPAHAADDAMAAAFHVHQMTDKGFGAAAGPKAPEALAAAFRAEGYRVETADSPWRLGDGDRRLIADLASGFAAAVRETGTVPVEVIDEWAGIVRIGAVVGHTDTLACPPA